MKDPIVTFRKDELDEWKFMYTPQEPMFSLGIKLSKLKAKIKQYEDQRKTN